MSDTVVNSIQTLTGRGFGQPESMVTGEVICVCGGDGFPLGGAPSAKIIMVGKTLKAAGMGFRVLHCGPSPIPANTRRSGVYDGIPFEYTTSLTRPRHFVPRLLVYLRGVIGLTRRLLSLRRLRPHAAVYLYVITGPLVLYAGWVCRLLGLPVVQDMCEWFVDAPACSRFTRWLYKKQIFRLATGVVVISEAIEQRVKARSVTAHPGLLMYRLPCIVDVQRFVAAPRVAEPVPHFVWCGTEGWVKDVLFMIRALAIVRMKYPCKLRILGTFSEDTRRMVLEYAAQRGVPQTDIVFAGCVDDRTLESCYKSAAALLLPLWRDDRSITRLPNKLGEYLASGRPVISCNIGDLRDLLEDNESAYLAEPGNEADFADRMIGVLRNPDRADAIGAAGLEACMTHLDYHVHVRGLAKLFVDCIKRARGTGL